MSDKQVLADHKAYIVAVSLELIGLSFINGGTQRGSDIAVVGGFLLAMFGIGLFVGSLVASFLMFQYERRKGGE